MLYYFSFNVKQIFFYLFFKLLAFPVSLLNFTHYSLVIINFSMVMMVMMMMMVMVVFFFLISRMRVRMRLDKRNNMDFMMMMVIMWSMMVVMMMTMVMIMMMLMVVRSRMLVHCEWKVWIDLGGIFFISSICFRSNYNYIFRNDEIPLNTKIRVYFLFLKLRVILIDFFRFVKKIVYFLENYLVLPE